MEYNTVHDLHGLKIATSYPNILQDYLDCKEVDAKIVKMGGAVEVAAHLKISDVICDLVSTGSTLEANGLKSVEVIMQSQAILIEKERYTLCPEKAKIVNMLKKRMDGVVQARDSKYVMLNAPKNKIKEITSLLSGAESSTIVPLADDTKVAIHTVCSEPILWETMEELKNEGATSILVLPIEKMID